MFAGDIKFLQLMIGIKTGNASYPCPFFTGEPPAKSECVSVVFALLEMSKKT